MQIRTRLTLQFIITGGLILIIASVFIYYFSSNYRKEEFNSRLKDRALSIANLLFVEYEVDASRVRKAEYTNPVNLHDERIIILNSQFDTIYNTDFKNEIKIDKNIIEKIATGYNLSGQLEHYDVIGFVYFTNYDMFIIINAANDVEGKFHLEKLSGILVGVFIICLFFFFIIGWFASGKAIKPVSDIVNKIEEVSASNLNIRLIEPKTNDEIGRLAKSFNKMLKRLEISFTSQKNFIANASHELRTPMTAINGQLEVLLMKDRSTQEYVSEIESILKDTKSLIHLLNSLLLLARTSSEMSMNFCKKIRIDELLWQIKDEFKRYNKDYSVNIEMDSSLTDSDQMEVLGDESLLKVAISNIIDNACKYSSNHTVIVRIKFIEKFIELEFEDRGAGIPEDGIQKIFEPFYRMEHTSIISGHGIGLTLTNQIIKNHQGHISVFSELNKGTSFIIKLPIIII
jgi:signal transduction histidine kinase